MSENRLNWFPGHMAKSFRQLKSELGRVHLIIECRDARIPLTSANPKIDELIGQRERLVLLTKSDLVSREALEEWLEYFKKQGVKAAGINLKARSAKRELERILNPYKKQLEERDRARGRKPRPLCIANLGIPNVGKSTLGNLLLGKKSYATENRPGLTRGISFILSKDRRYELMDSPGLLWPKLDSREEQARLALCMAIPDRLLPIEELALDLIIFWSKINPASLANELGIEQLGAIDSYSKAKELLLSYAKKYNLLQKGGEVDIKKASDRLLLRFRTGKSYPLCLESCDSQILLPNYDEN